MDDLGYDQAAVSDFGKLCDPWAVAETLNRSGFPEFPPLLTGGGFTTLGSLFAPKNGRLGVLKEIIKQLENNAYYRSLIGDRHYKSAFKKFERKLRNAKRLDEYEMVQKRIRFINITGNMINLRRFVSVPVYLEPDKDTIRATMRHVEGLLDLISAKDEWHYWVDYQLSSQLRKFKLKLASFETLPRVDSLSADNFFVYLLANSFISEYGEAMTTVIGDLCQVINYDCDKTTIERWVKRAQERNAAEKAAQTPAG
ncbi:MAG TPA: hypothetical protein VGO35_11675 [Gammaproteobacteria bacterium]|jgi:hypothetical protein|nr:hypothetical protein [Gammaproteobacteria bacterium]